MALERPTPAEKIQLPESVAREKPKLPEEVLGRCPNITRKQLREPPLLCPVRISVLIAASEPVDRTKTDNHFRTTAVAVHQAQRSRQRRLWRLLLDSCRDRLHFVPPTRSCADSYNGISASEFASAWFCGGRPNIACRCSLSRRCRRAVCFAEERR